MAVSRAAIEEAFENRNAQPPERLESLRPIIESGLSALDRGELRAARFKDGEWVAEEWVKKLILLSFHLRKNEPNESGRGQPKSYDKIPLKFEGWSELDFQQAAVRIVPGAVVRRGAHVAPGTVLMPCFVNIGAHVGRNTMIDTWATVGSCAQIGARCHISGGAGIGGVLEPLGERPVIIEDDVFVGARAEIAEGVVVRRGAVIGMGVFLGSSTPIVDRETGATIFGEVPEGAVVVSGARAGKNRPDISVYAAVIVKYADARTRSKTALNMLVREGQPQ